MDLFMKIAFCISYHSNKIFALNTPLIILTQLILLEKVPIILMHGFGGHDDAFAEAEVWLRTKYPDTLIWSAEVGGGGEYSKTTPIHTQCTEFQKVLKAHPDYEKFKNGFIAWGNSQGGYFWRHYTQMINDPPVKRIIATGSPLGGVYDKRDSFDGWANKIRDDPYSDTNQKTSALANWWRDPYKLQDFNKRNQDLALLDNIRDFNETRRQNLIQLDRFIISGDDKDQAITPPISVFFGVFVENSENTMQYYERDEYKQDLFGLKTLAEQNKFYFYRSKLGHASEKNNFKEFHDHLIHHFDMDQ